MFIPTILKAKDAPTHLAFEAGDLSGFIDKNKKNLSDARKELFSLVFEIIELQHKKEIPVVTISMNPKTESEQRILKEALNDLLSSSILHESKHRLLAIGDWYGLETSLVDELKSAMDKTRLYDAYFLNLCIRYEGKQELLTAIKLIIKKVEIERVSPDTINEETIKQNLPSSYLPPPELFIMLSGPFSGLLLWDSPGAYIHFEQKNISDLEKKDIEKALDFYNANKKKNN